jgi:hypothetical protein
VTQRIRTPRPQHTTSTIHRHLPLVMAVVAMAVFAGVELMAPDPLALPLISLLTFGIAAVIALAAWATRAPRDSAHVTAWDLAGAFTLIGCAAAMLTQNEQALDYFLSAKNR